MKDQIYYWAHMLDESKHASYYEMYMLEHPEDKMPKIIDTLIAEFAESLKKDHINLNDYIVDGKANFKVLEKLQKKINSTYNWERISANVYAAVISRSTALMSRAKGQRIQEHDKFI